MQDFTHVIRDELGIHARPAGVLVKLAAKYKGATVTLEKDGAQADMKKLFRVMGLAVKCGDKVTVTVDGEDEITAITELRVVFDEQL